MKRLSKVSRFAKAGVLTLVAVMMMGFVMCMPAGTNANAAGKKVTSIFNMPFDETASYTSATKKYDINGDGKLETLTATAKVKSNYDAEMKIKVGNKVIFSKTEYGYSLIMKAIKANGKTYFWIEETSDNDDASIDALYVYKNNKLKKVLTLESQADNWYDGGSHIRCTSIKPVKGGIKVNYGGQPVATGYSNWSYTYKMLGGRLVKVSSTASIKSTQMKNNVFTAKNAIDLYSNKALTKKLTTLPAGATMKLKSIITYRGKYILKFSYSGTSVYISADQYDIFENVQLAG